MAPSDGETHAQATSDPISDDMLGRDTDEGANHNNEGPDVGSHGDMDGMWFALKVRGGFPYLDIYGRTHY